MFVGVFIFNIYLPGVNSLKDKRKVLTSISTRLKNRFNISLAEVGKNDLWQRAEIGISYVSSVSENVQIVFDKILNFLNNEKDINVIDYQKIEY